MKVLVTGGGGFVGGAIIDKLLQNGFEIYSLLRKNSAASSGLDSANCLEDKSGQVILRADICNEQSLEMLKLPGKIEAVIHSAGLAHQFGALNENDFRETNVKGTENMAEWAARRAIEHFILISSVAVYGKAEKQMSGAIQKGFAETNECRPDGIYAQTKLESENAARKICESNGIRLTILRLATVVGENDRGNVARLIEAIDRRRFVPIGGGANLKSLIYKGDVAQACLKVLENKTISGTFNLTADALPMREIVGEIELRLGRKKSRFSISPKLTDVLFRLNERTARLAKIEKLSETVRKWLSDDVFAGEKFRRASGFQPETSIQEAIKREVEYYRRQK